MKAQTAQRRMIPMLDLRLEYERMKEDVDRAITRCLDHQRWIFGPEVRELEEKAGAYLGAAHCVGTSSGTEALVLALRALAIKSGREYFDREDMIITTPFTFTATGDAILRSGATPVFIDIDPATYNLDAAVLKRYLESGAGRPVGIVPVHLYGCPCDMKEIMELARRFKLFVVEDVAQAFGGVFGGRRLGSIGDAGAFSFFPSKNLGGFGDGGMLATGDAGLDSIVRMLIKHGGRDKYNVEHVGYNARLDTLQAAVVLSKLGHIEELNAGRRAVAGIYSEALSGMQEIVLPAAPSEGLHVYNQYTIRVRGVLPDGRRTGLRNGARDDLQDHLRQRGVDTMVYYPVPLHKMKVFHGRCAGPYSLGESEQAVKEVLSLPIEPFMPEEDVRHVAGLVREFFAS
ncbi:MAG: DegT/DnrJ/EryC1/StrS family aminotransferase [Nitrospiraceae bacterium]|nr:DegT/DnrJ/EryC1/StrS family aminotransferase [Nitrospiraceae bacterium]